MRPNLIRPPTTAPILPPPCTQGGCRSQLCSRALCSRAAHSSPFLTGAFHLVSASCLAHSRLGLRGAVGVCGRLQGGLIWEIHCWAGRQHMLWKLLSPKPFWTLLQGQGQGLEQGHRGNSMVRHSALQFHQLSTICCLICQRACSNTLC